MSQNETGNTNQNNDNQMMQEENAMMREYECLKTEILKKMDTHHSLVMFAVTTTVAIFALEFIKNDPRLYLLPFFILIPVAMRINYLRSSIAKISAYIIAFIEPHISGLNWESKNAEMSENVTTSRICNVSVPVSLTNWECFGGGLISCVLYLWFTCPSTDQALSHLVNNAWLLFLLTFLWLQTIIPASLNKQRTHWIAQWKNTYKPSRLEMILAKALDVARLYISQVVIIAIHLILQRINDEYNILNDVGIVVVQNIVLVFLIFIFVRRIKRKHKPIYDTNSMEVIILVLLLNLVAFFTICGIFGNSSGFSCAALVLSLYFGFSVSLKSLIEAENIMEFCACFIATYKNAGLSRTDRGIICIVSFVSLLLEVGFYFGLRAVLQ